MTKTYKIPPKSYCCYILSAYTNAMARILMYDQYKKIPPEDLLYTDTDNIIFKGNYLNKYQIGTKMGEFKLIETNVNCNIIKEKALQIGTLIKISGLRKDQQTTENFQKLTKGENINNNKMITYEESLKANNFDYMGMQKKEEFQITTTGKRQRNPQYYKNKAE